MFSVGPLQLNVKVHGLSVALLNFTHDPAAASPVLHSGSEVQLQ